MYNKRLLFPPAATGPRLVEQVRDMTGSDVSFCFQQTAWLKSRSGPMVLAQQNEAQIAEFFRLDCVRRGLGHATATQVVRAGKWVKGVAPQFHATGVS